MITSKLNEKIKYINTKVTAVFDSETEENKKQLERVSAVALKLNSEIGIVSSSEE